jgi:hypothetical protein
MRGNLPRDPTRHGRRDIVKIGDRFALTPGTALAVLALFFALGGSAFAVGQRVDGPFAPQARCANGLVRGIAAVTGGSSGTANISDKFTGTGISRRYNCAGRATQVRRVDVGIFEVRFVGVSGASAVASAPNDSLVSAEPVAGGAFRITIHPAGRDDRVDLPFTVIAA